MPQAQGAQLTDHLPQRERTFVARKLRAAWANTDAEAAERDLRALARALDSQHPGGAASILEGLEETLTVTRLGLTPVAASNVQSRRGSSYRLSACRTRARMGPRSRATREAGPWPHSLFAG